MKLLIVRHAIALEREEWAKVSKDDRERPISEKGAKRMKKAAKGLKNLFAGEEPDILISSTLLRAKQTAEIVIGEFVLAKIVETETLAPEQDVDTFAKYLRSQTTSTTKITACVGHEPHLNHLIAWLVSKSRNGIGEMKKGGACLLEFDGEVKAGGAKLIWLLTSSQLRDLA